MSGCEVPGGGELSSLHAYARSRVCQSWIKCRSGFPAFSSRRTVRFCMCLIVVDFGAWCSTVYGFDAFLTTRNSRRRASGNLRLFRSCLLCGGRRLWPCDRSRDPRCSAAAFQFSQYMHQVSRRDCRRGKQEGELTTGGGVFREGHKGVAGSCIP